MTKIIYQTGDLFDNGEKLIVHSCNVLGGFGSGVAGVIARLYPEVRKAYIDAFESGILTLGSIIWSETDSGIVIGNMICQPTYGTPNFQNIRHVSYDAVDNAMRELNNVSLIAETNRVAMPLIGSALGGGSWSVISGIIEHRSTNFQPIVYTLDGKIPA